MARIDFEQLAPRGTGPDLHEPGPDPERLTVLDLVAAVAEFAASDAEVIAVVEHLIGTGRVQLAGGLDDRYAACDGSDVFRAPPPLP